MRGVRRTARRTDRRHRLPGVPGRDDAHPTAGVRPVRRVRGRGRCSHRAGALRDVQADGRPRDGAPGGRRACGRSARDDPRVQVRRTAVTRRTSGGMDARGRRRLAARRRRGRPGAAPPAPALEAGVQPGRRPRGGARAARRVRAPARAANAPAGRAVARGAVAGAPRCVHAGAADRRPAHGHRDPRPVDRDRRRRHHDRRDGRRVRRGAPGGWRASGAGAQRGASRGSRAATMSAVTASGDRSPSMHTQPDCPA